MPARPLTLPLPTFLLFSQHFCVSPLHSLLDEVFPDQPSLSHWPVVFYCDLELISKSLIFMIKVLSSQPYYGSFKEGIRLLIFCIP